MKRTALIATLAGASLLAGAAAGQPGWDRDRDRDRGSYEPVPEGSWQRSCRDITVQRGELSARCESRRGGLQFSSIRYRECRREIVNWDGRLTCGRPDDGPGWPGGPGGPGGGGRAHAVLYADVFYRGRQLEITGDTPDLTRFGFNDQASSIRVTGGTWQVCEHVNYEGRCNLIVSDVDNFVALRINDTTSSVRRVR
jgi:hypothetical protein